MAEQKFEMGKGFIPEWYIPFPSQDVNKYFDKGGIPAGTIIQIQSDGEGTFKSTIAIQLAIEAQKLGHTVAYIDAENAIIWGLDDDGVERCKWFETIGLDSTKIYYVQGNTQEKTYESIKKLITKYDVKFVILDAVPSLEPESVHEKEAGENIIGLRAKINTTELNKLTGLCRKHQAIFCAINHKKDVITNQGSMGKKAVGGRGYGFYSQLIIVTKRSTAKSKLEGNDIIDLSVYIEKNKFGTSFIEVPVKVKQGEGITPDFDLLNYALKEGLIEKRGAGWYRWIETEEPIAQGSEQIMSWVKENRDLIRRYINV